MGTIFLLAAGVAAVPSMAAGDPVTGDNMNGEYLLAPTPNAPGGSWSTNFKDYPGGVESFTFYAGPVSSTYGEVFWTNLPEVPLPEEIVERFKGKAMAVVGHESDQVRKGAGPNGEDVSLPINLAYNHHYGATMLGEGSKMERVPYDPNDGGRTTLLSPEPGWDRIPIEHTPSNSGLPTSLWCGYSNGGEFRKSYHGLAPPFVQIIESPRAFDMTPMQIDTWNRDKMNLTGGPFVPGPYPKKRYAGIWPEGSDGATKWPAGSLAPSNGSDAIYSGLLECPLTTRIQKELTGGGWSDSFSTNINGNAGQSCPKKLDTAKECFSAANNISINAANVSTATGSSTVLPAGCSVQVSNDGAQALVYFNTNSGSSASCGAGVDTIEGVADSLVSVKLSISATEGATISLTGPADGNWFGVGFNTHVMAGNPYAIVVDGIGRVTEHVLGDHVAGTVLNTSVQIRNNTVQNGLRTVVLTRPLIGLSPQHYTFNPQQLSLDFICALGSTSEFSYHKTKTVGSIVLWPKTPSPYAGGIAGLFTSNLADSDMRNDWDGEVGFQIVPKQQLTIVSLGRAVPQGQKALKAGTAVNIWSVATRQIVATTVVGPAAGPSENGFAYVDLKTPLVLAANQPYYITQTCTKGMADLFSNTNANAGEANLMMAALGTGVFSNDGSPGKFPTNLEKTSQFAGIVTFKARMPPNPHPAPATACICAVPAAAFGQGTGTIKYVDPLGKATESIGFPPRCEPYPRETVLRDQNPTCDIRTYVGGLSTCHHGWHLLDADQEVPWQDQPLEYYFKWRIYFQEYDPSRHISATGWNTGIGGNTAEYDVPQCPAGTPVENCTHEISGVVTPPTGDMHFVGAHYHCHAPTCLRMEIYNNVTGELICAEEPYHGQGADVGGKDRFDQAGYIAQRVCLWGNSTYGLEKPPKVGGVPLFIRAITNSTYGHHGEMALPQMLVANL